MYTTNTNYSKRRPKKSHSSKDNSQNKGKRNTSGEPWYKITGGVLLLLFALLSFFSILSYWFTHNGDQAYISDQLGNAEAANWCAALGAYLSHICCDFTFGIFAIGLSFLAFLFGLKITFDKEPLGLFPITATTLFTMAWLSSFTAFFVENIGTEIEPNDYPAGAFGNLITGGLIHGTGKFATFLILFALLLLLLFFCYKVSPKIFVTMYEKVKDKWAEGRDARAAKSAEKEKNKKSKREKFPLEDDEDIENEVRETEDLSDIYSSEAPGHLRKEYNKNTIDLGGGDDSTIFTPQNKDSEVDFEVTSNTASTETEDGAVTDNEETTSQENEEPVVLSDEHAIVPLEPYDPRLDLSFYKFPSTDLLLDHKAAVVDESKKMQELRDKKERIEQTLKSFGIAIKKIYATIGPTVTLYEIVPMEGIRISKIKNLEDDIALSLAALGIRIIAPIPGKGTIGIEVPNANPQIVPMKAIIDSDKFQNNKYELPIGLGKTISDEPFVADLAKMPHLLMAGATGQGKSVGLNAIIASLLYKKHPSELKFVLIDPKKVEFTLYKIIERHYLAMLPGSDNPIITDTKKVIYTLNSLCAEMDARYDLLQLAQVRNIKEYNAKFCARKLSPTNGHRYLPYIVLIIDEFGDLIMTAGREVETPIARLAQLARAIGIHLVIATQRPSVNIITGIIKANFPSRIAFRVTSVVDSRTILDGSGANQLIGKGDMLLSTGSDLVRLQCAFIDTPEVEELTRYIADQQGYPEPFLLPEYSEETAGKSGDDEPVDPNMIDSCFMDAATLIVETQMGSTSLLQRKMKLGYARAGRIMDQLEEFNIVGPSMGSKVREVKVKTSEELRVIFQNMGLI